jgi:hypothetical protein
MKSDTKVRLVGLLAAVVVTTGLAVAFAPVASGIDRVLHEGIPSLSPAGRAIVGALGESLAIWLPLVTAIVLALGAGRQRRHREDAADGHGRHDDGVFSRRI